MISGVNGSAPVYTAPLGASGDTLTPDALMLYCAAQLHGLDGQVQDQMKAQQAQRDAQTKITQLKQDLTAYESGGIGQNDPATKERILNELKDIYDTLPAGDPTRGTIQGIFDHFRSTATCNDDLGNRVSLDKYTKDWAHLDANCPDIENNKVTADEVKGFVSDLDGASGDIGKNADIQMINLQSLVSQRQMAVQIATNLINKINETTGAVVQNIK